MQEQVQNTKPKTTIGGGSPLGGVFADSQFAPTVTVRHGVHTEHTHGNQTVGEVRERLRDRLGLSDEATAFIDGQQADADARILPHQTVTFMRKAGEKGSGAMRAIIAFGEEYYQLPIRITNGVHSESVQTDCCCVGDLREQYRDRMGIADDAQAFRDGQPVDDDAPVFAGEHVAFLRRAGEIGG